MTGFDRAGTVGRSRGLHVALWVVQVLLGICFILIGGMKLANPSLGVEQGHLPLALVVFIGLSEVAGGLGVLLPALTRVRPGLTPLAALGLLVVMILATLLHVARGEWSHAPVPVIFGAMAAFVAWGRSKKEPIAPRGPPLAAG